MVSLYYAQAKEKESDCKKFNVSVQLIEGNYRLFSATLFLFPSNFLPSKKNILSNVALIFFLCFLRAVPSNENELTYKLTIKVL